MSHINDVITVNNEKALSDALKKKYGLIYVEGEVCEKIKKSLNSHKFKKGANIASWITAGLGLAFWPLLIAGGLGLIISKDDLKKYSADIGENRIELTHKNFLKHF